MYPAYVSSFSHHVKSKYYERDNAYVHKILSEFIFKKEFTSAPFVERIYKRKLEYIYILRSMSSNSNDTYL